MQHFNFINFVKIIDLSLLNYIDYANYDTFYSKESLLYLNDSDKLEINITPKSKKLLISLILNNINNSLNYGKTNIILNTCKPMDNWRQYQRNSAIRSYKYIIQDDSITFDLIKFNQWVDKIYKKLPRLNVKNFSNQFVNNQYLSNIDIYDKNIIYLNFKEIDIYDAFSLLQNYLKYNGSLSFDEVTYNIISDGNFEYAHDNNFPDDIKESIKNQLIENKII